MNKYYTYPEIQYWGDGKDLGATLFFDEERFKRSESGKFLADARSCRYLYKSFDDPEYLKYWEDRGCKVNFNVIDGEKCAEFVPMDVFDEPDKKYPILLIVRPHEYYAMTFYKTFFEMAAQGEFIAIVYSSESIETNEVLLKFLDDAIEKYHADPTRVYVTGHSHYGALAVEFAVRHKERIAGVAQMSDEAGVILGFNGYDEARIEMMHNYDMPLINVGGTADYCAIFPINDDAQGLPPNSFLRKHGFAVDKEPRIESWKNRTYAMRVRVPSTEELESLTGREEKVFGYPADHMFSFYAENVEHYVADFVNPEGKVHFRTVAIDNLTHATCHVGLEMVWSFLRRFARDQETEEVIELF